MTSDHSLIGTTQTKVSGDNDTHWERVKLSEKKKNKVGVFYYCTLKPIANKSTLRGCMRYTENLKSTNNGREFMCIITVNEREISLLYHYFIRP